jgi:hypothetical protein
MVCILLPLVLGAATNMKAQVSIGTDEAPVQGALLQMKEVNDNVSNDKANDTKGLGIPRVELTERAQLYPMFPTAYDKTVEDAKHTGLMVWNTNASVMEGVGVYYWDGKQWVSIPIF